MAGGEHGFHPFQVDAAHLAYTILGAFTVIFGLFSLFIKEKLYLGEAPIATVVGIILGGYVLKLFDPADWGGDKEGTIDYITLEVTRVVIALSVFSIGVELPKVRHLAEAHSRERATQLTPRPTSRSIGARSSSSSDHVWSGAGSSRASSSGVSSRN